MTIGTGGEALFRRPRRWPWVVGVLAIALGVGVALGATLLDDDSDRRVVTAPEISATPSPEPSPEPSESAEASPSSEPTDSELTPSADPTQQVSPSVNPATTPSRTSSPTPRPTRTPTPTRSPGYPPPGLRLEVAAEQVTANRARIRVHVTDTDGTWNGGHVDFGDGTSREFPQSTPACSTPRSGPYQAAPSDRTVDLTHDYPANGTYDVFVRVRTDRPCENTPVEQASKVVSVSVGDPTPGPTPTPILTPPARP
jgi:DNA-directed RNA polymerase II subunit RPB1